MRDRDVGKVRVDGFYNLVIVVPELLKLEIKVVKPCDELHLRRVASDDNKLLAEDSFDDKTAAVMFQTSFAEQLVKADVLLFIEPERVLITRCSELLCVFSVGIHNIISVKKAFDWGERPASQSEHLSYAEKFFGIQRYSSLPSGDGKNPRRRISDRSSENPPLRLPGGSVPGAILQPFRDRQKKSIGADWSGLERTSKPKRFTLLYIASGIKESVCEP